MSSDSILNLLNDAQRAAVTSESSRLLVLAGAGSGKTRVLVHRIAWLIQTGQVSPAGILAVTFTNRAAAELRHRVEQILSVSTQHLWIGTFHGIAHRLLRMHWADVGLTEHFQILDSDDQQRTIKRMIKLLNLDEDRWPARQAQWFINEKKDQGLRAQHIDTSGDLFLETMQRIYAAYEQHCQQAGVVDFAELLLRAHELWLKKPEILKHYQQRFSHVLVDEFQDTNAIQYAWIRLLTGDTGNLTIVGDDDQSIYGWRGAKIENIQQFDRDVGGCELIRLEQNYRSTAKLLQAANAVIANNEGRLGKQLWTQGDEGASLLLYSAFNEVDEARFIVEKIQTLIKTQEYALKEIAILYRSNAQSRALEEAFLLSNVNYRIYGGLRFFERAEIKNALAYLRLILSKTDDGAFERVINLPLRGIGDRTLEAIRSCAREQKISLWHATEYLIEFHQLGRSAHAVQGFLNLILRLDRETASMHLWEQTQYVIQQSNLMDHHRKEKGEKGENRIENLKELMTATRSFQSESDSMRPALQQFLDHTALESGEGQASKHEDAVQLMTMHSAKGLEFPVVFLAGMEEGLFPHQMSSDDPDRLEEERRLCYVGITRAMKQLIMSHAETRRIYGEEKYHHVSRFVREIPSELIEEVRMGAAAPSASFKRTSTFAPTKNSLLGKRVRHTVFGEGVVLRCEGQGAQTRAQVSFSREGTKWLMLEYAQLELIG